MGRPFRSQLLSRSLCQEVADATEVIARRTTAAGQDPVQLVTTAIRVALDGSERFEIVGTREVAVAIAMYLSLFHRHQFDCRNQVAQEAMYDLVMNRVRFYVGGVEATP